MSWTVAIVWSVVRSSLVTVIGIVLAQLLNDWLSQRGQRRTTAWVAVLLPFFVPSLVTGYCYRDTAMSLVHMPWGKEVLYGLIVTMQLVPVAVVILAFSAVQPVSESAIYLGRLYRINWWQRCGFYMANQNRRLLPAAAVLFLLSFQEADLAALMQASGWPEWMFTKHAGGLPLSHTVRLTLWPIAIQLPLLLPVIGWVLKSPSSETNRLLRTVPKKQWRDFVNYGWVAGTWLFVVIIPIVQLCRGVAIGFDNLMEQPSLPREIGDAMLLAITVMTIAVSLARWLTVAPSSRATWLTLGRRTALLATLLVPGLMGSLPLGLVTAEIFQTPLLNRAYDTPVPLLISETLLTAPRTMFLVHCLDQLITRSSRFQVGLLARSSDPSHLRSASALDWVFRGRKWFATCAIVSFWVYFEVMLPSILAMPGLAPIGLVLYNGLHYGRIAALGAKLAFALVVPLVLTLSILFLRRLMSRWGIIR